MDEATNASPAFLDSEQQRYAAFDAQLFDDWPHTPLAPAGIAPAPPPIDLPSTVSLSTSGPATPPPPSPATRVTKRRTPRSAPSRLRGPSTPTTPSTSLPDALSSLASSPPQIAADTQFQPSAHLIAAFRDRDNMRTGCSSLLLQLDEQVDAHVDQVKAAVRAQLRERLDLMKDSLSPPERTRARSRRGAAVSRVKTTATLHAWENAANAFIRIYCCCTPTTTAHVMDTLPSPTTALARISLAPPPPSLQHSSSVCAAFVPTMTLPPAPRPPDLFAPSIDTISEVELQQPRAVFELSITLQRALFTTLCPTSAPTLCTRLSNEIAMFVERKKDLVREELKQKLHAIRHEISPQLRIRARSRRGAAVTRFKNAETTHAWRDAVRWLATHLVEVASPQPAL